MHAATISDVASATIVRYSYPLTGRRFSLHARLSQQRTSLRVLAFASSCYVALAIGANNVANAVGPLSSAGIFQVGTGLLLIAPMFGIGAHLLGGPAQTIGRDLVPLGLLAATICNIVVASLLVFASYLGLPQSLVHPGRTAHLVGVQGRGEEERRKGWRSDDRDTVVRRRHEGGARWCARFRRERHPADHLRHR